MAAPQPDFDAVYDRLKGILEPYAPQMCVTADAGTWYGLDLAPAEKRNEVRTAG